MVPLPFNSVPDEHEFPDKRHRGTPKLPSKTASCGPLFPPVGGLDTGDELIGAADELSDGDEVGRGVGLALGLPDGLADGPTDGEALGDEEGSSDGDVDGFFEGLAEGDAVGLTMGAEDTGASDRSS